MNFTIDVDKWVNNMVPGAIRKPIMKAFTKVLASPMLAYFGLSDAYFQLKLDEIAPYILTDFLQARLRVLYPNTAGPIYKCFVYNEYELMPQVYLQFIGGHMLQEFDYSIGETFTQQYDYSIEEHQPLYDYIVAVPVVYNTPANVITINLFLNKYKPAGKVFNLVFQNII